ncbi:acylphosphatase [Methanolobus sp. ZRKC3]|uniref:acylphosphatase n=1 Tax=Methanolobus sp. ZRKC3 TaxID=3125786 RepID=UPI0032444A9C
MAQGNAEAGAIASATIFVSGKVQGVYFRKFTRDHAVDLGLKGFVQNLPDGRVMLVAEGNRADVKTLVEFLYVGPQRSNVEDVNVEWSDMSGEYPDFAIRR